MVQRANMVPKICHITGAMGGQVTGLYSGCSWNQPRTRPTVAFPHLVIRWTKLSRDKRPLVNSNVTIMKTAVSFSALLLLLHSNYFHILIHLYTHLIFADMPIRYLCITTSKMKNLRHRSLSLPSGTLLANG